MRILLYALEHDPEKWEPVFGKRSCSNKELERDDDSKKSHPALERRYTGTRTVARSPPIGLSESRISPPCERAMSLAMARPSPVPPSSWLRASSRRRNGLNTSSRSCGGIPGPSSSTVTLNQR